MDRSLPTEAALLVSSGKAHVSPRVPAGTTSTSESRRSANTCIAGWVQKGRLTIDRHTSFRMATRTSPDRTSDLLSADGREGATARTTGATRRLRTGDERVRPSVREHTCLHTVRAFADGRRGGCLCPTAALPAAAPTAANRGCLHENAVARGRSAVSLLHLAEQAPAEIVAALSQLVQFGSQHSDGAAYRSPRLTSPNGLAYPRVWG